MDTNEFKPHHPLLPLGNDREELNFDLVMGGKNAIASTSLQTSLPEVEFVGSKGLLPVTLKEDANLAYNPTQTVTPGRDIITGEVIDKSSGASESLGLETLNLIGKEAIERWSNTAFGKQSGLDLNSINFTIEDLPGSILGQARGNTIAIDPTAAGYGWFIDSTPSDDVEFSLSGYRLLSNGSNPAFDRVDLLTVVSHEIGHTLGLDDLESGERSHELMAGVLLPGERRLPQEPFSFDLLPKTEIGQPHNLLASTVIQDTSRANYLANPTLVPIFKNTLESGFKGLVDTLNQTSEIFGKKLLSIPGLIDNRDPNNLLIPGLLGNEKLGTQLDKIVNAIANIASDATLNDLATLIDNQDTQIGALDVQFNNVNFSFNPVNSTPNPDDYELLLNLKVTTSLNDNFKLDLGRKADLLGIQIDYSKLGDLALNTAVNLDLKLGTALTIAEGNFGGQADLPDTSITVDTNDFFVRQASLQGTAGVNNPNLNFGLNVGFLGVRVENGSFNLNADINANVVDPNNSDGLNRITLNESTGTPTKDLTNLTSTGNLDVVLPVKVEGIPGVAGDFFDAGNATIEIHADGTKLFDSSIAPTGGTDPRTAPPISISTDFKEKLTPFKNINSADIISLLKRIDSRLAKIQVSEALNLPIPLTQDKSLGEILGLSDILNNNLIKNLLDPDSNPLFNTAQSLAVKLDEVLTLLDKQGINAKFDPVTQELTFHIKVKPDLPAPEVPIGFNIDLGELGGFSTNSEIKLTPDFGLEFTFGIDLSGKSKEIALVGNTPTSFNGVLSDNAVFSLKVGNSDPVAVTVSQSDTANNQTVDDLFKDIEAALKTAGLDQKVTVKMGNDGKFFLATTEPFLQVIDTNSLANQILGLQENQTAANLAMVGSDELVLIANAAAPTEGKPGGDVSFGLVIDGNTVGVNVANTADNQDIDDLIGDINSALAGTSVLATSNQDKITLYTTDPQVKSLQIVDAGSGLDATVLGLTLNKNADRIGIPQNGVLAGDAVFTVTVDDRDAVEIKVPAKASNANVSDPVAALIDDINAALNDSVLAGEVFAGRIGNRIVLATDSQATQLAIDPVSDAAKKLGIQPEFVGKAKSAVDFFVQDAKLNGSINLSADDIEAAARFGFVGVDIKGSEKGDGIKDADVTASVNISPFDVILKGSQNLPANGVISDRATFDLAIGSQTVSVSVDSDATNANVADLVTDIQTAVNLALTNAGISTKIKVQQDNGAIAFSATSLNELKISNSNTIAVAELGLSENARVSKPANLAIDWSGNVTLRDINVATGLPGLNASNLEIPITVSNSSVFGIPKFTPDFSNLQDLLNFEKLEFSDLVGALDKVASFLADKLSSFDALNKDLPLVGVSAADLLTFTQKFTQVVAEFKQNPTGTLQDVNDRLIEALGLPVGSNLVSLNYNSTTKNLLIDLNFSENFSKSLPINLDISSLDSNLPDALKLQGNAGLEAKGGATAKLSIGIDLSAPTNPVGFINLPNTEISAGFAAEGNNISFTGAFGPLGLFVNNGMAVIDGDGNAATDDLAKVSVELIDPTPGDNRILFDEFGQLDANVGITGALNTKLPIFFPTESNYVGQIGLSVPSLQAFFNDPTNPANFITELPDLSQLIDSFKDFSLLDNLHLAIEGIETFLAGLQDVLDGEVFGVKLPLVGDKLGDAATFIQDFRTDLYSGLRNIVDNSVSKTPALIQQSLFDILGPSKLDLLRDLDNSGTITLNDINILGNPVTDNFVQWEMSLGSNAKISKQLAIDLGLPALGIEINGGFDLNLDWSLDFGFGLNREDGFYFVLSDDATNPELEVDLDASIPNLDATGNLGFLKLNAKDRADDPTHFNASFDIDLFEKGATGDDAKKLGLFELGNLGITPNLSGEADVNLQLKASVDGSMLGGKLTGVLPSIVSDFDLLWTFDNSIFSGNPGNLQTLAFNNVGLDLGSFLSDFLKPIVQQIQDITEPLKPIIKILTDPLPVISDLAGEDITLIDLAKIFGYGDFGMIEDVADIIDLIESIPTDAGNVIVPFGDLVLIDNPVNQINSQSTNTLNLFDPNGLKDVRDPDKKASFAGLDNAIDQFNQSGGFDGILSGLPESSAKSFTNNLKSGEFGALKFPIISDPSQVFGLLLGRPAALVTYDMRPLEFEFEYSQFFPIIGPLGAEITGTIGAVIDLAFGFDTYGVQKFADGNYKHPLDIFRGFYVSDRINADGTGTDVPEAILYGSLVGAAVLNLGIAKGGVGGGVFATVNFDLNDPEPDGRVRIEEILNNIYLGAQNPTLSSNPITAVFDISGLVEAKLVWFVKALGIINKSGQIGPSLPLLDFNLSIERPPVLASDTGGGVLRLNMGDYAGDRLHKNTTDGDEEFIVTQEGSNIKVEALGETQIYKNVSKLVVESGAGNDKLTFNNVTIDAEIDGGSGNDFIDLRNSTGNATIGGGSGDDIIHSGGGSDRILGEKGSDFITGGGGNDYIDGGTEADILSGDAGLDSIVGGEANDTIGGGADSDYIDGGAGDDRIWGDSSFDQNKNRALNGTEDRDIISGGAGSDEIFGEGGTDLIGGGIGSDIIEGNSGEDEIWGDSDFKATGERIAPLPRAGGHDTISGNEGSDRIFGEDANDFIHGNTDNDTVEGGFGADSIFGDEENDLLLGQADSDLIFGGAANDTVIGGTGNDLEFGDNGLIAVLGEDANNTNDDVFVGIGDKNQLLGFVGDGDALTVDLILTAVNATDGNDIIDGGAGDDIAFGGAGSDKIFGDSQIITSETPTGKDVLFGDGGRILLNKRQFEKLETTDPTFGGNDEIIGNNGDDIAVGGAGQDIIKGGHGTGIATTASDADILLGDNGEILFINREIARINATNPSDGGDDTLEGNEGDDALVGGTGSDLISGNAGNDIALGDNGVIVRNDGSSEANDIFSTFPNTGGDDSIAGDSGDDLLVGGDANDAIEGNDGEDILAGDHAYIQRNDQNILDRISSIFADVGGTDTLQGNAGDDKIIGGFASDLISGNEGNDIALGDNGVIVNNDGSSQANDIFSTFPNAGGDDSITGDIGDDLLVGGDANDAIEGNDGDDVVLGDHAYIKRNNQNLVERISTIFEDVGGNDTLQGNVGNDKIIGGFANDLISGNEGNDIALGDNGVIVGNDGSSEANDIFTQSPELGGSDTISGDIGNDIIVGGASGDRLSGKEGDDIAIGDNGRIVRNAQDAIEKIETTDPNSGGDDFIEGNEGADALIGGFGRDPIEAGDGIDIALGDNGRLDYTLDGNLNTLNLVTTTDPTAGDVDIISGGNQNDLLIGGTAGDIITAGNGNDLVFGDHGKAEGIIDLNALPLNQPNPPFTFTAIDTQIEDKGGDELIYGEAGDDIILGQQGSDRIFGGEGEDDIIGGHNVAGGADSNDSIDGGTENDVITGDNAIVTRRPDNISTRMRVLAGEVIYDDAGNPLITANSQPNPTTKTERNIQLLDHSVNADAKTFGNDAIAGGANNDMIFGQLGNDVIQGDSSIAEKVSLTDPSVENSNDGDDYIEGNGGNDLIFGNLGQDDIIGDSSSLFGNDTSAKRPTGQDTIFGGAGTQLDRNNLGDQSATGHARDADAIVGDNGNIFRLVGVKGNYSGKFLTFTYDNYSKSLPIIPRAIQLLDYTLGGNPNNLGGDDLILGEAGDDVIYGMTGNDVLFGNAQDDDIFGGTGHDRIYGGTGEDGVLGDDGRIITSRNGETETLYGIKTPDREGNIGLPGPFIGAIINEKGRLKKEARWLAFNSGGNDVIYGGLGDDFLHGGAGDDGVSGAEALPEFYNMLPVTNFNRLGYDPVTRKLAAYDALNPRLKINNFFLNFEATNAKGEKVDDGKDYIFGDFGNDWLVGGTRNDRMFGGMGDDLLNADDNHDTNNGLNNRPDDPEFADGDFAFGGGGLDVMIANTGRDRLFDWTGEFNSFIVPFSPFGEPTIVRSISPHVVDFLLALGEGSGADQNLTEPNGELGLVTQKDPQWGDQHGAPRDPQPGNIPGVQRDTQGEPEWGSSKGGGNSNQPPQAGGFNGQGNGNANLPPQAGGSNGQGNSNVDLPPQAGGSNDQGNGNANLPPQAGGSNGQGNGNANLAPEVDDANNQENDDTNLPPQVDNSNNQGNGNTNPEPVVDDDKNQGNGDTNLPPQVDNSNNQGNGNTNLEPVVDSNQPPKSKTIEVKTYTSNDSNLSIPDLGTLISTLTIPDRASILDLNIQLGITHDRSNDIDVFLNSPDGKSVKLFANVGGNSNKLGNATLDDDASLPVSAISNPNATIFRPEGNLSTFNGLDLSGSWTLEIRDTKKQKTGSLKGWSMVVTKLG